MAHLEGFSTVRPPFYNGDDFRYWKGRMECFLKTQIEMWIVIQTGFTLPTNESGESLDYDQWTNAMKRQVEADAKATQILQCGLSKEELNRVGPFISAKDLWNKLIELHEGTTDAKICKRDLLMNKLYTLKMQDHETSTQLHARIQDVVNNLHAIGQKVENRDLIRYALNAFPRTTLWASMVDAYKVSKDLSKIRLDELFSDFELHEQSNSAPEKGIALYAGSKKKAATKQPPKEEEEDEDESEEDDEIETELVNLVRKMFKRRKQSAKQLNESKSKVNNNVRCYECNRFGHIKTDCPKLKNKAPKYKKALNATWEESSGEEDNNLAFMAKPIEHEQDSESEQESEPEEESDSESDFETLLKTSHGSESGSKGSLRVSRSLINTLYNAIKFLTKKLAKSESKVETLVEEVKLLKHEVSLTSSTSQVQEEDPTRVEKLEVENSLLKSQVEDLRHKLERFTLGSKGLDLILGSQRAVYNKAGLGFSSNTTNKSYMSIVSRHKKSVQAWVPKTVLISKLGSNKYWVPKDQIHYVERPNRFNGPGGASIKFVCVIT